MAGAFAPQEARERDQLIDDRQVGVELGVLLQKLSQLAAPTGQLALHTADRQMRVKSARLLSKTKFCMESIVEGRLQPLQLFRALLNANPQCSRFAEIREGTRSAAGNLERLELRGHASDDA